MTNKNDSENLFILCLSMIFANIICYKIQIINNLVWLPRTIILFIVILIFYKAIHYLYKFIKK
jgi:hypothetical protein